MQTAGRILNRWSRQSPGAPRAAVGIAGAPGRRPRPRPPSSWAGDSHGVVPSPRCLGDKELLARRRPTRPPVCLFTVRGAWAQALVGTRLGTSERNGGERPEVWKALLDRAPASPPAWLAVCALTFRMQSLLLSVESGPLSEEKFETSIRYRVKSPLSPPGGWPPLAGGSALPRAVAGPAVAGRGHQPPDACTRSLSCTRTRTRTRTAQPRRPEPCSALRAHTCTRS